MEEKKVITVEEFKKFMESEEGKKILNPMYDTKVSTAINTWKANNLDKVINDELVKRGHVQTEEQKRLLEMQKEIDSIKQEKVKAELKAVKLAELNANGLDASLANYIHADNEEGIRTGVNFFKGMLEHQVKEGVKKALANSGAKPDKKAETQQVPNDTDAMKMSYHERVQLQENNPTMFNQLMGIQ